MRHPFLVSVILLAGSNAGWAAQFRAPIYQLRPSAFTGVSAAPFRRVAIPEIGPLRIQDFPLFPRGETLPAPAPGIESVGPHPVLPSEAVFAPSLASAEKIRGALSGIETQADTPRVLGDYFDGSRPGSGEIIDGTLVEGSRSRGGEQVDILVSYRDPNLFREIVAPAHAIGAMDLDAWEKVRRVRALVRKALPRNGRYRASYHRRQRELWSRPYVSLGHYLRMKSGVCRENGLLAALALREAGLTARFGYFAIRSRRKNSLMDHAVALLELDGETYVIDTFRPLGWYFNRQRLSDLTSSSSGLPGPSWKKLLRFLVGWSLRPLPFPAIRYVLPYPNSSPTFSVVNFQSILT